MGRGGPNKGPLFDLENFRHLICNLHFLLKNAKFKKCFLPSISKDSLKLNSCFDRTNMKAFLEGIILNCFVCSPNK